MTEDPDSLHKARRKATWWHAICVVLWLLQATGRVAVAGPAPAIDTVFPAGARAGQSVEVTIPGSQANGTQQLVSDIPGFQCQPLGSEKFRITSSGDALPGVYALWAVGPNGAGLPRTFVISHSTELLESEPNETLTAAQAVPLNSVVNGGIEKGSDRDHYQFAATRGQRVVVECHAERIDSKLRAVLEMFDSAGRRLDVNRGYFGTDPLLDFRVPEDGTYVIRVHDLISSGGPQHLYRLEFDTGPRVAFAFPPVIEQGKSAVVTLYGWNLSSSATGAAGLAGGTTSVPSGLLSAPAGLTDPMHRALDALQVSIPAERAGPVWPLPRHFAPAAAVTDGFPFHLTGSQWTTVIGVTDLTVIDGRAIGEGHRESTAETARPLTIPCEVTGQLTRGDQTDWYAVSALRGEVLYFEGLGERIGSPVDLQLSVFDGAGEQELVRYSDEQRNLGGKLLPTSHADPSGRWVAPADGTYRIAVTNLTGGRVPDPRRVYRLRVQRESPDFRLILSTRDGASLNVRRGGRAALDVTLLRQRGLAGPVRIRALNLPGGLECPDVWLGPGVDRGVLVVSADPQTAGGVTGELSVEGFAESIGSQTARAGAVVRGGTPEGWSRLVSRIPVVVTNEAPLRVTADGHETLEHHLYGSLQVRHAPGGVLDVAVQMQRADTQHTAPVRLTTIAIPEQIGPQTGIIPDGQNTGYLSFALPPTLPPGRYSVVIAAETTVPVADQKVETMTVCSNVVTFQVEPAGFRVVADPFAPQVARRGEVFQVGYSALRQNGFIGKIHTELAEPGRITDVTGLRGRGETFVGQSDQGSLQITVNDDAPLGPSPFLRLFSVGVVEDQPAYFSSSFLKLEIVE